jgi:hypothetical protein
VQSPVRRSLEEVREHLAARRGDEEALAARQGEVPLPAASVRSDGSPPSRRAAQVKVSANRGLGQTIGREKPRGGRGGGGGGVVPPEPPEDIGFPEPVFDPPESWETGNFGAPVTPSTLTRSTPYDLFGEGTFGVVSTTPPGGRFLFVQKVYDIESAIRYCSVPSTKNGVVLPPEYVAFHVTNGRVFIHSPKLRSDIDIYVEASETRATWKR